MNPDSQTGPASNAETGTQQTKQVCQ